VERWTPIPLRLIVGYGFVAHGVAKLMNGPDRFIGILHSLGVPLPQLFGWATIGVEIAGGLAVLAGAFVPLASLPMAAILVVAALTVHRQFGFSSIKLQSVSAAGIRFGPPGYETDLLYLACLAALVLGGSGAGGLDAFLAARRAREKSVLAEAASRAVVIASAQPADAIHSPLSEPERDRECHRE